MTHTPAPWAIADGHAARVCLISELTGAALDWAVAKCKDEDPRMDTPYSTEWAFGGPIIEREGIELLCESLGFRWVAIPQKGPEWRGPTPLVAAMRCYVASKLGDTIDVPQELINLATLEG